MRIIHCTKKLLKELDVSLIEPDKIPQPNEGFGNWYANLLRLDRKKCLLFTNEKSLYTFLIPKVLKANLKSIEQEFLIILPTGTANKKLAETIHAKVLTDIQEGKWFENQAKRKPLKEMIEIREGIHRLEGLLSEGER